MRVFGRLVVLACLLGILTGAASTSAADPSPTAAPTPSNKGCDRLDGYLADRQRVSQQFGQTIAFTVPSFLSGSFSFEDASSAELLELSDATYRYSEALDMLLPPPVAVPYHDAFVALQVELSLLFRDMGIVGIEKAFDRHRADLDGAEAQLESAATAALSVCPAFQTVLDWDDPTS